MIKRFVTQMKNHKPNIMFIEINANKWNPKSVKTNICRYFCHKITLHLGVNPPSKFAICVTCNLILNVSYMLHIKIFCTSDMEYVTLNILINRNSYISMLIWNIQILIKDFNLYSLDFHSETFLFIVFVNICDKIQMNL